MTCLSAANIALKVALQSSTFPKSVEGAWKIVCARYATQAAFGGERKELTKKQKLPGETDEREERELL